MRLFVFIFLILFFQSENQFIRWDKNRKLTIADFKKKPPVYIPMEIVDEKAMSDIGILSSIEEKIDSTLVVRIEAVFCPLNSWFLGESQRILLHEQIHFDIAEVAARKLRKAIIYNCSKAKTNDLNLVERLISLNDDFQEELQNKYDRETFHSIVEAAQQEWEQKVSLMLDSLEDYSNMTEIIIAHDGECIFPSCVQVKNE